MSDEGSLNDAAWGSAEFVDDDARATCDELMAAIEAVDIDRTKGIWRHFDVRGVDPFDLVFSLQRDEEEQFECHSCDRAFERGEWIVLARLLRMEGEAPPPKRGRNFQGAHERASTSLPDFTMWSNAGPKQSKL